MTLVEVLIALVLLLLSSLAMMQTALVSIQANMKTVTRDEAVSLGDEAMIRVKDMDIHDVNLRSYPDFCATGFIQCSRNIRNSVVVYKVPMVVTEASSLTKQVVITVNWDWQGEKYSHNLTTIVGSSS